MAKRKVSPKATRALARYTKLRKQAKAQGITVPRGTKLPELQRLVAGKTTTEKVRASQTAAAKKKTKTRATRVPRGAKRVELGWGW